MAEDAPSLFLQTRFKYYAKLILYSAIGVASCGYFSYRIIMLNHNNLENRKNKTSVFQRNQKMFILGGLCCASLYIYGFWHLLKRAPDAPVHSQMLDYAPLSIADRTNPAMQNHYVINVMKEFGVSQKLIEKTKREFQLMIQQNTKA